ncbi:MAG: hypothetical protein AB7Q29_14085 [Vicinamibacterales bacterium]
MHQAVLLLHSWVRWIAILSGLLAVAAVLRARDGRASANNGMARVFTVALDVQFLLGLALLFTLNLFGDIGATMRSPLARFYAIEHPTMMIAAVAFAHMGKVFARKALTPASARVRALVCYGLALLLLVVGTPWPGTRDHRPLFRL